ncbi:CoA transferase [Nocardia sp. CA-135398]|uniref:CoA transferase n=1 Tax=Nocardia sp. CA-135398 TaxID=3239977 RepID=UPI003D96B5CE
MVWDWVRSLCPPDVLSRPVENQQECAALAWAASGAMDLTGRPDGVPVISPAAAYGLLLETTEALARITALIGSEVRADPGLLLTGRAGFLNLRRGGQRTAGGAGRLLRTSDGWCAITLSRRDDIDSVPAILGVDSVAEDPWETLTTAARDWTATDLANRAQLLGVPAAALPVDSYPTTGSPAGAPPADAPPAAPLDAVVPAAVGPAGAVSAAMRPPDAPPADARPADARPADARPAGAGPAAGPPADAGPANARPAAGPPADAGLADAGAAADARPAGAGPAGAGPAGAGPADAGAAAGPPAGAGPAGAGAAAGPPADAGLADAGLAGARPAGARLAGARPAGARPSAAAPADAPPVTGLPDDAVRPVAGSSATPSATPERSQCPWQTGRIADPVVGARLDGAVVVDLSSMWAGPLCAHLLGRAGARVVKVESTRRPDGARRGDPRFFDWLHAGHEQISVDFHTPEGQARLRELLSTADVVIEASRPRALAQLGLAPGERVHRDGQVWLSLTGYGRAEPMRVAFGDDAAVAGGLVGWEAGEPVFCGDAIADPLTGICAALAVCCAVRGGGGQLIDLSMRATAAAFASAPALTHGPHRVLADGADWLVECPHYGRSQPVLRPRVPRIGDAA